MNDNHEELQKLKRAVHELSILNEIATAINSTMRLAEILELIVEKCMEYLLVEQGSVQLLQPKMDRDTVVTLARKGDTISVAMPYRLDDQLTGWMIHHGTGLFIENILEDPRFRLENANCNGIMSVLSVPLMLRGRMTGMISLFNKQDGTFDEDDKRLLSIIAAQSAQIIENARLLEEERELQKVHQELDTARRIQEKLLNIAIPEIPGYSIAALSKPARAVGGDLYDAIPLSDTCTALCVADVSGKGIAAAILMACLQSTVRGQVVIDCNPSKCVEFVNRKLFNSTTPEKYATLFYGVLNHENHTLCYTNGGHNKPLVISSVTATRSLETSGLATGLFDRVQYQQHCLDIEPGDILLIFSDGISEALSPNDEEYGEKRLIETVQQLKKCSAHEILEAALKDIHQFMDTAPQHDDITLMVLKRENEAWTQT